MTLQGDVLTYLDMYKNFIIGHDIPTAIQGNCNYLAALGLSTYTEVFGGLFRGRLDQDSQQKTIMFLSTSSLALDTQMLTHAFALMD